MVIAIVGGERYLVSMLGDNVQWVHNVRAAGGRAVLRSRGREAIRLEEVLADQRAPILKAYLQRAPGARPHVPINKDAAQALGCVEVVIAKREYVFPQQATESVCGLDPDLA